jgi:hypothetical protein
MAQIFLTDLPADVAGYKLALVGMRNPYTTGKVTSVTNTTSSGDNIECTDTAGGTAVKWITKPMEKDVAIAGMVFQNIWCKESNASGNAGVGMTLHEYTTSEQTAFLDTNGTVEAGTTIAPMRQLSAAPTGTTIDAGNRLAIKLQTIAVGTMGASQTLTVDYDGAASGVDGDTYIDLAEELPVSEVQQKSGSSALDPGLGHGQLVKLSMALQEIVDAKLASGTARLDIAKANIDKELAHL